MTGTLPGRPHLAHLKKQAKQLLSAYRMGDAQARTRFTRHLPGFQDRAAPALHDAQSVIAREHGSPSWQQLREEVRLRVSLPHGEPTHTILVPAAGERVRPADRHITRLAFAPDGDVLLSAGMDGRIRVWSVDDWSAVREVQARPKSVNTLSFHADGQRLAVGSSDGTATVWTWPGLEQEAELPPKRGASSHFAPLGDRIYTVGLNGRPALWSWPELEHIGDIRAHPKKATAHAFTPDGDHVVTCGLEGSIAVTRLVDGETVDVKSLGEAPLVTLGFVPGVDRLIVGAYGGSLRLLSWPDLDELARADIGAGGVYTLAYHPSEDVFAMCVDRGVQLRRNETLELLETLAVPAKGVYALAFSPDDRWLVEAGADQRIRVWEMTEGPGEE